MIDQITKDKLIAAGFDKAKSGEWVRLIPEVKRDKLAYLGGARKYERILPARNGKFYVTKASGAVRSFDDLDSALAEFA